MVSYEVLAGIWLIVGCINVLLTADDDDLRDEPLTMYMAVNGIFIVLGPLLLLFAIWIAIQQIRDREDI